MLLSDSHCHLDSYPQEDLEFVLAQIEEKNIAPVLTVSINLETSQESIKIAQSHANVLAAIGFHPNRANDLTAAAKKELEEISTSERVAAIGEIGLDYSRPTPPEIQREAFAYQLSLAKNVQLPVNIHYSMDAHQDVIDIVKKENGPGLSGIVHNFRGDMKILRDWLDLDFYISLGEGSLGLGDSITGQVLALADGLTRAIPRERLLTETDSMAAYTTSRWRNLGGQSYQPMKNPSVKERFRQPADVIRVVEEIASVCEISVEDIGAITTENLQRILKLI